MDNLSALSHYTIISCFYITKQLEVDVTDQRQIGALKLH